MRGFLDNQIWSTTSETKFVMPLVISQKSPRSNDVNCIREYILSQRLEKKVNKQKMKKKKIIRKRKKKFKIIL